MILAKMLLTIAGLVLGALVIAITEHIKYSTQ